MARGDDDRRSSNRQSGHVAAVGLRSRWNYLGAISGYSGRKRRSTQTCNSRCDCPCQSRAACNRIDSDENCCSIAQSALRARISHIARGSSHRDCVCVAGGAAISLNSDSGGSRAGRTIPWDSAGDWDRRKAIVCSDSLRTLSSRCDGNCIVRTWRRAM